MKTYCEFISEAKKCWPGYKKKGTQKLFGKSYNRCVKEGKIPWDDQNRPLRSGWTPREKNRAKRVSTGVENPNIKPSGKQLERYGKLKIAHDDQKNVKTRKDQRHKNPEDYSLGRRNVLVKDTPRMPSESKHGNSAGLKRIPRGAPKNLPYEYMDRNRFGAANDEKRDKYYEKGPKGLKEPKESFEFELEESSTGERSRGRATLGRGRGADMTSNERSIASIAKKAGIKGTGKYSTKDLRTPSRLYTNNNPDGYGDKGSTKVSHYVTTHASPRSASTSPDLEIINKREFAGIKDGKVKFKHHSSADSVRKAKDFKKAITRSGGDKRGKVHDVSILPDDAFREKNQTKGRMPLGRNLFKGVKDISKHLKAAGAKKGKIVVGKPTAVLPDEDKKIGAENRGKFYGKILGSRSSKRSEKTGVMVGKV